MNLQETKDYIIYRNTLILAADPESSIQPPQVELECRVKRRHVTKTSFVPNVRRHVAYGNFTFNFELFRDDNYSTIYQAEEYPIDVNLGDDLYLAASVDDTNDLVLFIDTCWATPSANPWDNTTYQLISNG